jgi:hypothetical protein
VLQLLAGVENRVDKRLENLLPELRPDWRGAVGGVGAESRRYAVTVQIIGVGCSLVDEAEVNSLIAWDRFRNDVSNTRGELCLLGLPVFLTHRPAVI